MKRILVGLLLIGITISIGACSTPPRDSLSDDADLNACSAPSMGKDWCRGAAQLPGGE